MANSKETTSSMSNTEELPASNYSVWTGLKSLAAGVFFYSAYMTWRNDSGADVMDPGRAFRRQLSIVGDSIPLHMEGLMKELRERQKLFEETPPEEVQYWFEYTGPLQVSYLVWRRLKRLGFLGTLASHVATALFYFVCSCCRNISIAFPDLVERQTTLKDEMTRE